MASLLEVIEGISMIMGTLSHDGATKDGKPVEIGLEREKEYSIYEERVVDGFTVVFHQNMLTIKYQTQVPLAQLHDKGFETDMRDIMKKISSFLKEEYKSLKKSSIKLTEYGDIRVFTTSANRMKAYVCAQQTYEIAGTEYPHEDDQKEHLANLTKGWMQKFGK